MLTPEQIIVISALSNGASTTDAAAEAGIHRNTIANWRRNSLPFQHALADAQYDRALYYRECAESLVDQAFATIHDILADPNTPAGVRLKAALSLIQLATTPPDPKKQIELIFATPQPSKPVPSPMPPTPQPVAQPTKPAAPIVHNSAQPTPIRRVEPKVGRNEPCPCGSGLKFKRCCVDKPAPKPLATAA